MIADKLRKLAELRKAATEGPWIFDGNCGGYITESGDKIIRAYCREDAAFIAAAGNLTPEELDALAALEAVGGER